MFEEYLKNKIDEAKEIPEKDLIEFMYKNGYLLEIEYEKYISQLEEKEKEKEKEKGE